MRTARGLLVPVVAASVLLLSACGAGKEGPQTGPADNEGTYLVFPNDLTYQIEISRFLNPGDVEDQAYLRGLPPNTPPPGPGEAWFAVFLRVSNETNRQHLAAQDFRITDTQGEVFRPIPLDGSNVFAYQSITLPPKGLIPTPNSPASEGSIVGSELLFKLPNQAFYNRPVEFQILSPFAPQQSRTVDLDI